MVIPDHQPGRLGLDDAAAGPQELAEELADIRRGGVGPSPGGAQLPPIRTVPIPLLGLWISAPRFGRGAFHLARDHLFQLEPPEPGLSHGTYSVADSCSRNCSGVRLR